MFLLGVFFTLACGLAVIVVIAVYEPKPDDRRSAVPWLDEE